MATHAVPAHTRNETRLQEAERIQREAAALGFDWTDIADVFTKIQEELNELREAWLHQNKENLEHELGDLLFSVVNVSRFLDISCEQALAAANARFVRRFNALCDHLRRHGKVPVECSAAELDRVWETVKQSAEEKV
jgi:uncharacterized protein YabN with tetrapyrrole methylase and pyrophosphatase domain